MRSDWCCCLEKFGKRYWKDYAINQLFVKNTGKYRMTELERGDGPTSEQKRTRRTGSGKMIKKT